MTHQNRLLVSFAVSLIVVIFPPWRATFKPLRARALPEVTIGMPWPAPSLKLEGVSWSAQHEFSMLVPIFTPPRPSAEYVTEYDGSRTIIGVWSVGLDLPRLIALSLVAFALSFLYLGHSQGVWRAIRGQSAKAKEK